MAVVSATRRVADDFTTPVYGRARGFLSSWPQFGQFTPNTTKKVTITLPSKALGPLEVTFLDHHRQLKQCVANRTSYGQWPVLARSRLPLSNLLNDQFGARVLQLLYDDCSLAACP